VGVGSRSGEWLNYEVLITSSTKDFLKAPPKPVKLRDKAMMSPLSSDCAIAAMDGNVDITVCASILDVIDSFPDRSPHVRMLGI